MFFNRYNDIRNTYITLLCNDFPFFKNYSDKQKLLSILNTKPMSHNYKSENQIIRFKILCIDLIDNISKIRFN